MSDDTTAATPPADNSELEALRQSVAKLEAKNKELKAEKDRAREAAAETARDILGFRTSMVDGTQKLTQLRLYKRLTLPIPDSEYGEEVVEQVLVLEPGAFKLFQKRPSRTSGFELVDEGATTMKDIPLALVFASHSSSAQHRG